MTNSFAEEFRNRNDMTPLDTLYLVIKRWCPEAQVIQSTGIDSTERYYNDKNSKAIAHAGSKNEIVPFLLFILVHVNDKVEIECR